MSVKSRCTSMEEEQTTGQATGNMGVSLNAGDNSLMGDICNILEGIVSLEH